jgi:hypothetical protein
MPDPSAIPDYDVAFAGEWLIHDCFAYRYAMVIAVKRTTGSNLYMSTNRYVRNERMQATSGLNVRALAD